MDEILPIWLSWIVKIYEAGRIQVLCASNGDLITSEAGPVISYCWARPELQGRHWCSYNLVKPVEMRTSRVYAFSHSFCYRTDCKGLLIWKLECKKVIEERCKDDYCWFEWISAIISEMKPRLIQDYLPACYRAGELFTKGGTEWHPLMSEVFRDVKNT